jgi:Mg/Co/Ni transporter MgtE
MDQHTVSRLPATTLRTGIIVGAVGAFSIILAPQIMQSLQFGPAYSQALGMVLHIAFQLVTLFFLPFSAALIAASLVMRHLAGVLAPATKPDS